METYTAPVGRIWKDVGTVPHTRKDGLSTMLRVWESCCVKCGAPIQVKTPVEFGRSNSFGTKHCDEHKSPFRVALGRLRHQKKGLA